MKLLYIDCSMGAAGDMLAGALFDLLPESGQAKLLHLLNENLSGLAEVSLEHSQKNGITGKHFHVLVNGREEGAAEEHPHEHHHEHHHHEHLEQHQEHPHEHHHAHHHEHHSLTDVLRIIDSFSFPENIKHEIKNVYALIADAESRVHGKPVGEIHFHEVGAMDAIADISAVCLAMAELNVNRVTASPVVTGFGTVRCAHGLLPVPAPATAALLTGLPTSAGDVEGELCTPTGAALVRHFADSFGVRPNMVLSGVGRGLGTKDFSRPNILQAFLGEAADPSLTDVITELSCNLDDMTGEEIGFAAELLLDNGALDVFTQPIQMKKFRPGILLTVLCRTEDEDTFVKLLFKYTSTLGVRKTLHERYILARKESTDTIYIDPANKESDDARIDQVSTEGTDSTFEVRKKTSRGYGVTRSKYEYEDLANIARKTGKTLREVREEL